MWSQLQIRSVLWGLAFIFITSIGSAAKVENTEVDVDYKDPASEDTWPAAEFASPEARASGFATGESYTFRMKWAGFPKAGTTYIRTESIPSEDGKTLLSVTSATKSHGLINLLYPVKLDSVALLDTQNWRLTKASMRGKEGNRRRDMETVFDYDESVMQHVDRHYPDRTGTKKLPYAVPLDDSSALLQVRGWDMVIGAKYPLLVSSKGKLYLLEMEIKKKERLKTAFGKQDAYRVVPISAYPESKLFREGGHFTIWISADEKRIPLRFDVKTSFGIASMLLEDYEISENAMVAEKYGEEAGL